MNEVHLFPALMASRLLIFLWNLSTSDEAVLVVNLGKRSFAGGEGSTISAFLPKKLINVTNKLTRLNYISQLGLY